MKRLLALLPLPVAILLRLWASRAPEVVERVFSGGVYPALAAPVSRLAALCPVPLAEVCAVLLAIFVIASLCRRRPFRAVAALGLAAAVFVGGWSLNYLRLPLEDTLSLSVQPATPQELAALCRHLAEDANARYTPVDGSGLLDAAPAALNAAAEDWPIPAGAWGAPKAALSSAICSRLMIEGFTSPWTGEALVNANIPAPTLPFVACHESAHLRGFAREEDADIVAYLACEASDDARYRYSGAFSALLHALNALSDADRGAFETVYASLSDEVRADMRAHDAYWAAYRETPAAQASARVSDVYLRGVSVDQSARSYGRMVDLLLALARADRNTAEGGKH